MFIQRSKILNRVEKPWVTFALGLAVNTKISLQTEEPRVWGCESWHIIKEWQAGRCCSREGHVQWVDSFRVLVQRAELWSSNY